MIHDSNAGAQAVMSHMGAPGADGWYFNPYVLRARIRSGRSGQDVVDLAGTGSAVGGRVKLGRLRLAVPGNKAMRLNESTECMRVKSSLPNMERSAADGTPDKGGLRDELSLKVPGHYESRSLGNALDRTTELAQYALSLFLECFLVASKIVWMLVAVEEFNSTRRRLNLHPQDSPRCDFLMSHPGRRVLGVNEGHNAIGTSSCPMRFLQRDSIVRICRRGKVLP